MSDKEWLKADEFVGYAPCGGNIDFVLSPQKLGKARADAVKATCATCPVSRECVKFNLEPVNDIKREVKLPSNSIWVAGVWLPPAKNKQQFIALAKIKADLLASVTNGHMLIRK